VAEVGSSVQNMGAPNNWPVIVGRRLTSVRLREQYMAVRTAVNAIRGPTKEAQNVLRFNLVTDALPKEDAELVALMHIARNANSRVIIDPKAGKIVDPNDELAAIRNARSRLNAREALYRKAA
jgi:hypothetical protein